MSNRILSTGSAAAVLAALVVFAGQDSAEAARCPLGQIYRPSRGICVTKAKAIEAGIYHHFARVSREEARAESAVSAAPKPRHEQALAAIEKRAPRAGQGEEALAYTTDAPKPQPAAELAPAPAATPALNRGRFKPVAFTRPAPSPFGSLVALEPMP